MVVFACIIVQSSFIFSDFTECINSSYDDLERKDELYEYIEDVLHNISMVQATFNGYNLEIDKITNFSLITKTFENHSFDCVNQKQMKGSAINIAIFSIIIYAIYYLYTNNEIEIDKVSMTLLSLTGLFDNLYEITYYIPELTNKLGILENNTNFLQQLMKSKEKSTNLRDNFVLLSNRIEFQDVSFTFKNHFIFQSLNLVLPENKLIGLSGVSGSGKSTFIRLIFGIDKPQKGKILIDGKNIYEYDMKKIRQYISYINQNTNHLFNKTFFENVIYGYVGDVNQMKEKIKNIFLKFDLYEIFKNLDKNDTQFSFFDKSVGRLGENLSGGQKAIVHLMRLLINEKSKIIILDEVTASLDNNTRDKIMKYIKFLRNMNKTILLISHDVDVINSCDAQLLFSNKANPVFR
jgi:ABC-type multidrug transport system fused ATPase/permease subunit